MKLNRFIRLTSIASLLAFFVTSCTQQSSEKIDTPAPDSSAASVEDGIPLVMGHTYTIKSEVLGMDRRISIRLPNGYDEQKDVRFPIVYVIDGGPEQDFPHLAGVVQSRDVNGTFGQFILVDIETINRRHQIVPLRQILRLTRQNSDKSPVAPPNLESLSATRSNLG